ncbi:MAG TPA: glutamate 5-kinase [Firmicutes bacterium]|mgnify:FL=1|jgi:glutamate 5-kinase|nr:glutamate 5-kinase [Bacillota bacterium]
MVKYKRIVVKIGSSSLTHDSGKLNLQRIDHFIRQLVDLKNQGREVIFVTSGAVGAGMGALGMKDRPQLIPEQQAAAAVGQAQLMAVYNRFLREYGEIGAQILLTAGDLENRQRYLNAYNTMTCLLRRGVIPIINENDTVATEEIKFGDNDTLSALVAGMADAELLIILSDIDGLYDGDPRQNSAAKKIDKVERISPQIEALAKGRGSRLGTGGMQTKISAAKIAVNSGIITVIGPAHHEYVIPKIVAMLEHGNDYSIGTTFLPGVYALSKRKHWLMYGQNASGTLVVDEGAEEALLVRGKSLLPGGIVAVEGSFQHGDLVKVVNEKGALVGKGLVNYSSAEIDQIKGRHSREIDSILGFSCGADVIHRDNLAVSCEIVNSAKEEKQ